MTKITTPNCKRHRSSSCFPAGLWLNASQNKTYVAQKKWDTWTNKISTKLRINELTMFSLNPCKFIQLHQGSSVLSTTLTQRQPNLTDPNRPNRLKVEYVSASSQSITKKGGFQNQSQQDFHHEWKCCLGDVVWKPETLVCSLEPKVSSLEDVSHSIPPSMHCFQDRFQPQSSSSLSVRLAVGGFLVGRGGCQDTTHASTWAPSHLWYQSWSPACWQRWRPTSWVFWRAGYIWPLPKHKKNVQFELWLWSELDEIYKVSGKTNNHSCKAAKWNVNHLGQGVPLWMEYIYIYIYMNIW